jgi:hypothetical protein
MERGKPIIHSCLLPGREKQTFLSPIYDSLHDDQPRSPSHSNKKERRKKLHTLAHELRPGTSQYAHGSVFTVAKIVSLKWQTQIVPSASRLCIG